MIIIIGSEQEAHSKHIFDSLKKKKIDVAYLDSRKYPEDLLLSYSPNKPFKSSFFKIQDRKFFLKDIKGIYWRWFYGIKYQDFGKNDTETASIVHKECKSALDSIFLCTNKINWYNPLNAIEMHGRKAYQLHIMQQHKIKVPKTLITNDAESLREFWEQNEKNVIYKPVSGGATTRKLTEKDFCKEKLNNLKYCPIQAQECVDGVDIRVYAFKNDIFAAEIQAQTLDFREDKNATIEPVKLPVKIQHDCKKILELFHLNYSGIDIRKKSNGEYVFIEANPAPMFIYFEKKSGYPITETLIKGLIS